MPLLTLKELHSYLKLLENSAELKRKMPATPALRPLKEGLFDISRLVGIDNAEFKAAGNIAALVGAQRFVMLLGEPSNIDHVARIFDGTRVLLTVLIEPGHFAAASSGPSPSGAPRPQPNGDVETVPDSLKPLLAGNTALTCKLFRALFEHLLGFAPQGHVLQVSELTGTREHSRAFFSTALFILGQELDRENLIPFMLAQGLYGMHVFEYLLQGRDYCGAFYSFRRLERAFLGSSTDEETRLKKRSDSLIAQFGGKPSDMRFLEAEGLDKARVDSHQAALDLLEAMAVTPLCVNLNTAIRTDPSNSIRSVKNIARHFERFARGEQNREHVNQEIADHLMAFARQFSAEVRPRAAAPEPVYA